MKTIFILLFIAISLFTLYKIGSHYMNAPHELSPAWQERFNDIEKFNQFAADNPVDLSKIIIKQPLDGLHIRQGKIRKVFWKYTSARKGLIENVIFENGAFEKVDFSHTHFKNVTFKGYTIANSTFDYGQWDNVTFIDCQLIDNQFRDLQTSTVTFDNVRANGIAFSRSALTIKIENSSIYDSSFRHLTMPAAVDIKDSDFVRSHISAKRLDHFSLINSKADESSISARLDHDAMLDGGNMTKFGLNVGAKNITVRNVSGAHIGVAGDFTTENVLIENCKKMTTLATGIDGHIKHLIMKNVSAHKLSALSANIDHFVIENSEFNKWDFEEAEIQKLELSQVSLKEEAIFLKTNIEQHNLKDLNTGEGLQMKLEGSNITAQDLGQ